MFQATIMSSLSESLKRKAVVVVTSSDSETAADTKRQRSNGTSSSVVRRVYDRPMMIQMERERIFCLECPTAPEGLCVSCAKALLDWIKLPADVKYCCNLVRKPLKVSKVFDRTTSSTANSQCNGRRHKTRTNEYSDESEGENKFAEAEATYSDDDTEHSENSSMSDDASNNILCTTAEGSQKTDNALPYGLHDDNDNDDDKKKKHDNTCGKQVPLASDNRMDDKQSVVPTMSTLSAETAPTLVTAPLAGSGDDKEDDVCNKINASLDASSTPPADLVAECIHCRFAKIFRYLVFNDRHAVVAQYFTTLTMPQRQFALHETGKCSVCLIPLHKNRYGHKYLSYCDSCRQIYSRFERDQKERDQKINCEKHSSSYSPTCSVCRIHFVSISKPDGGMCRYRREFLRNNRIRVSDNPISNELYSWEDRDPEQPFTRIIVKNLVDLMGIVKQYHQSFVSDDRLAVIKKFLDRKSDLVVPNDHLTKILNFLLMILRFYNQTTNHDTPYNYLGVAGCREFYMYNNQIMVLKSTRLMEMFDVFIKRKINVQYLDFIIYMHQLARFFMLDFFVANRFLSSAQLYLKCNKTEPSIEQRSLVSLKMMLVQKLAGDLYLLYRAGPKSPKHT